jgi:tetratricopeptide (TPR) repeat protein
VALAALSFGCMTAMHVTAITERAAANRYRRAPHRFDLKGTLMSRFRFHASLAAALLAGTAFASAAFAHDDGGRKRGRELLVQSIDLPAAAADADKAKRPALYRGLGTLTMPVTTANRVAQAYFDQGWVLAWGFNHAEARRAFQEAQRLDPQLAMAYWGEAYVLGPNINDPMHDEAVLPARRAIERALALRDRATAKERALIEALSRRYSADAKADRAALDRAWAEAMHGVAESFPDDANVLALQADALMNLQPWDYWEADGKTPKKNAATIVALLEKALALDPDHPGAQHLYIHAVEASATPERAEKVADALRGATPDVGHLLHMPSHTYMRLGRHGDGIAVNRDAVAADERMLQATGDTASSIVRYGYYPHNVHFLMVSAQMAGIKGEALSAAEKLGAITSEEVSEKLAWVQAIKTASFAAHAQFSDAETVLALESPGDRFPFVKGFWHYARGVAHAAQGDSALARAEADAIAALVAKADMSGLEAQFLPARSVLAIARHVVEARIAQAGKDYVTAETHLRQAAELQASLPYTEPPHWYYPVKQTLGAVLLQQGRAAEAAATFQAVLEQSPRNGWALWGLMQAQIALRDDQAKATRAAFDKAWLGDDAMLTLDRL